MPELTLKVKPGVPETMRPDDNSTFEQWMSRIDRLLWHTRGISAQDLPDCQYRNWYDDRVRPIYAANRALRRATDEDEE